MNWYDVKLKQMVELEKLEKDTTITEDEKTIQRLNIIYGEDCELLTIPEYLARVNECKFLGVNIPATKIKAQYTINGHKYDVMLNPFLMTMGQYIDFNNLSLETPEKLYSIIFIPTGHNYNDGYDMEQVYTDMWELPAPDVYAVNRFFFRLAGKYRHIFRLCLKHNFKRMLKRNRKEAEKAIQIMDCIFTY